MASAGEAWRLEPLVNEVPGRGMPGKLLDQRVTPQEARPGHHVGGVAGEGLGFDDLQRVGDQSARGAGGIPCAHPGDPRHESRDQRHQKDRGGGREDGGVPGGDPRPLEEHEVGEPMP